MSRRRPEVSVVIPMHDEEANARTTLAEVAQAVRAKGWDYELVPVDDGSSDGTAATLAGLAEKDLKVRPVYLASNRGRGHALRKGFDAARGGIVVTLDADLSYSPEHVVELAQVLMDRPDVDVVLGSPYMPGGSVKDVPLHRLAVSRLGNAVLRPLFSTPVYTSTGILRAYRREVLTGLDLQSNDKEFHLEVLSKCLALGCRVIEVPATLTGRKRGQSHFSLGATMGSHLLFGLLERPAMLFAGAGVALLIVSIVVGAYLLAVYIRGGLNPERPLMTVMVLLFLAGQAGLGFAVFASQTLGLRRDLVRLQRDLREVRSALLEGGEAEDYAEESVPFSRSNSL